MSPLFSLGLSASLKTGLWSAVNPFMFAKLPFDTNRDFAAVSLLAKVPSLYLVRPDLPVTDLRALLASAPDKERGALANSGWVRHTLESAVWGLLTTSTFEEAVVQVVNLGRDADTAGAVVGAAGVVIGQGSVTIGERTLPAGAVITIDGFRWIQRKELRGETPTSRR